MQTSSAAKPLLHEPLWCERVPSTGMAASLQNPLLWVCTCIAGVCVWTHSLLPAVLWESISATLGYCPPPPSPLHTSPALGVLELLLGCWMWVRSRLVGSSVLFSLQLVGLCPNFSASNTAESSTAGRVRILPGALSSHVPEQHVCLLA